MKTAATVAIAIASIMIGEARAADMPVPAVAPPSPTATTHLLPTATTIGLVSMPGLTGATAH